MKRQLDVIRKWYSTTKIYQNRIYGHYSNQSFKFSTSAIPYQVSALPCPKLPTTYYCQDKWDRRLETPILRKVELEDFFYQIDLKYQPDKVISPIDVDLFVNKVTEEENVEEMEELIHRLRKSPSVVDTFPSTQHAVIRTLLHLDKTDMLFRILNDRMNYGVFLDHYTANLLMDKFLNTGNYKDAAKTASLLMLQEDFGPKTTKLFAIFSCLKLIEQEIPQGTWETVVEEESIEEEEVKVRVKYLRNPYFDDHFELTESQSIVGKTLAYAALQLEHDETLRNSIEVYGWALYDKWHKVMQRLKEIYDTKKPISAEILTKVAALAETRLSQIENSTDKKLPKPSLRQVTGLNLEPVAVAAVFDRLNWDAQTCEPLLHVKEFLATTKFIKTDVNLLSIVTTQLEQAIKDQSAIEMEEMLKVYDDWDEHRVTQLEKQVERFKEIQLLLSHQEIKKDLKEKEDTIFFFDHEEEWMMKLEAKEPVKVKVVETKRSKKSKRITANKGTKKKEDDADYVSPEI